jgi:hypothetical protein
LRDFRELFDELKQRNVFKVASIYLVTGWGAALGASELLPNFDAPGWVIRALVIVLLLLFPVVVGLAWFYEVTHEGVVRDPRDLKSTPTNTLRTRRAAETLKKSPMSTLDAGIEVVWTDQGVEKRRTFTGGFTAGRDGECEVTTLDPVASRRHARFEPEDEGWVVTDLGSSNGTLVNGERITTRLVPPRCSVQLGPGGQVLDIRVLSRVAETVIVDRAQR